MRRSAGREKRHETGQEGTGDQRSSIVHDGSDRDYDLPHHFQLNEYRDDGPGEAGHNRNGQINRPADDRALELTTLPEKVRAAVIGQYNPEQIVTLRAKRYEPEGLKKLQIVARD